MIGIKGLRTNLPGRICRKYLPSKDLRLTNIFSRFLLTFPIIDIYLRDKRMRAAGRMISKKPRLNARPSMA